MVDVAAHHLPTPASRPAPGLFDHIADTIGGTPVVRLHPTGLDGVDVWAKLEGFNPGGSAKDRSAAGMVAEALESGRIAPGDHLIESSSGNFGVAMAMITASAGLRFTCVIDPRTNASTVAIIRSLGASVDEVTEPLDGDWLAARIARVRELVDADPSAHWLNQYENEAAVRAHRDGTMTELVDALGAPDWLFVATSTTGTIGGCLALVRERHLTTKVVAVDAAGSVLFGGTHGERHLPGYGAGIIPPLAEGLSPQDVVRVADLDAVATARAVGRREGFLPGASGGAVCAAINQYADHFSPGDTVAAILHDLGGPYADTIYSDDWVADTLGVDEDDLAARAEEAW